MLFDEQAWHPVIWHCMQAPAAVNVNPFWQVWQFVELVHNKQLVTVQFVMQVLPWAFGTNGLEQAAQKLGVKHDVQDGIELTHDWLVDCPTDTAKLMVPTSQFPFTKLKPSEQMVHSPEFDLCWHGYVDISIDLSFWLL